MSAGVEELLPADFGKYRLVKRIATGGMAEIFLAYRRDDPDSPLVIKRILPHLVKGQEFVSMFLDEARIAARLRHENIVEIFDIGQIDGSYFIAMEYVHGEDIRRIYNCAYKLQRSLPLSHSIRVIAEAARGLGYAHKLTDFGRPMGLVHRDVSPQNILVTYQGGVKVVDFGIAKAANKVNQTRAGVLKGKYSYMSPEQALGDPIDHRTDIFALGIILYETTTGTRLFKRHNELATLQAIIKCDIVLPSQALPGYPPELERVLLRAIARDPAQRYDDAEELSEALFDFLHGSELYVERDAIAAFMRDLFAERLAEEEGSGLPVLPDEREHREEMVEATTPMKERSEVIEPPSVLELHERPSRTVRADSISASEVVPGFDGPSTEESGGTSPEMEENVIRAVLEGRTPGAPRPDPPETVLSPKARNNREPTELIRPEGMPSRLPEAADARISGRVAKPAPEATSVEGPPSDMLPTVAAQPVYVSTPRVKTTRAEPPKEKEARAGELEDRTVEAMKPAPVRNRDVEPERAAPRLRQEPTEQVRARAAVAAAPEARRERGKGGRDPWKVATHATQVHRAVPRVLVALAAIVLAALAGVAATRIYTHFADDTPRPSPARFGKLTVRTEPGALVLLGDTELGAADAQGVAGPFRVPAGRHELTVAILQVGFERRRTIDIEAERIHESEIRAGFGRLAVKVQPWARVYVDGRDMGITPLPDLKLYEGPHRVLLVNDEIGKRHETTVRITANQVQELRLNLNNLASK